MVYHRIVVEDSQICGATDRVLAVDFGTVRIGLAVSDALGLTAQGLTTLERTNQQADLARIARLAADYAVARIIVGNPISHSGDATTMSERAARFAEQLRRRLDRPVELWDERLTSLEADRALRASGTSRRTKPGTRDRMAAQILLQSYLDRRAFERAEKDRAGDTGAHADS